MADVETPKVEEETTPITTKEVTKEVPVAEPEVTPNSKPAAEDPPAADEPVAKEGENGTAKTEENGTAKNGANGNGEATNGAAEAVEESEEEVRKRKSESVVDAADATDGVSAEKKAKLEEKTEEAAADGIEAPANGEAEVTA